MSQIADLRAGAKAAYANEQFEEAAQIYGVLWTSETKPDKWDGWNYARSLRKLRRTQEALDVCRAVYKLDDSFQYIKNEYGWCIYQLHVGLTDDQIRLTEDEFFRAAEAIVTLCQQDTYSPYEKTIFRVLKYLKPQKKRTSIAKKMLVWIDKLDPEKLSTDAETFEHETETEEGASPREKWYMYRSSALFELGDYQACIQTCQLALESLEKLHYGNQHWFQMRIANSYGHLGDISRAIDELMTLARRKSEWFIYVDLAYWSYKSNALDDAFSYAVKAAQGHRSHDKLENKWELFLLMGQILSTQGRIERAARHVKLAFQLRSERGWGISGELASMVRELAIDTHELPASSVLFRELQAEWAEDGPRLNGKILTIKEDKNFGSILEDDGNKYHFKFRDFRGSRHSLREGASISYQIQDSFDQKKNQPSTIAVDVRLAW